MSKCRNGQTKFSQKEWLKSVRVQVSSSTYCEIGGTEDTAVLSSAAYGVRVRISHFALKIFWLKSAKLEFIPLNTGMNDKRFCDRILTTAKKINLINQLGGGCSKCGETRHWMLEFHHQGDKEFGIARKIGGRFSILQKEISKCICLCSNCHRETHTVDKDNNYVIIKRKMLLYKQTCCCEECGYDRNIRAFDFHHIYQETKSFSIGTFSKNVNRSSTRELSDSLKKELDKCIVLCSNCHKTKHYDLKFFDDNKKYIIERSKNIPEVQPPINKDVVRSLFESGMKNKDICKQLKTTPSTISIILKSFGLSSKKVLDK